MAELRRVLPNKALDWSTFSGCLLTLLDSVVVNFEVILPDADQELGGTRYGNKLIASVIGFGVGVAFGTSYGVASLPLHNTALPGS